MISTSERIKKGAKIVWDEFITSYRGFKPSSINIPNNKVTVDKFFLYDVWFAKKELRVIFKKRTFYKKIIKYKQINYHRYPIYSDVLYRETDFTYSFDLKKGESLDFLKNDKREIISSNILPIISGCHNVFLYPTWAQKHFIDIVHERELKEIKDNSFYENATYKSRITNLLKQKEENKRNIESFIKREKELNEELSVNIKSFTSKLFSKKKIIKTIFSFGLDNRKILYSKLMLSTNNFISSIEDLIKKRNALYESDYILEKSIIKEENNLERSNCDYNKKAIIENEQYEMDLSNVSFPFNEKIIEKDIQFCEPKERVAVRKYTQEEFRIDETKLPEFSKLKDIDFNKYKALNIAAVYILRNNDINKYYIGITMDVEKSFKRILKNSYPNIKELVNDNNQSKVEITNNTYDIYLLRVKNTDEMNNEILKLINLTRAKFICY